MATNSIFDRETLLDLTVNIIPLVIIVFFLILFIVIQPFGPLLSFMSVISFGLLVVPFAALAALTYISGKAIAGDESTETVLPPGQAAESETAPLEHNATEEADEETEGHATVTTSAEATQETSDEEAEADNDDDDSSNAERSEPAE